MRDIFIAANWKMNGDLKFAREYATVFWPIKKKDLKVAIAAPYTLLALLKETLDGCPCLLFAQNMHFEDKGAFTGEVSAPMLKELGVDGVIIGHSERRQYFAETDETVLLKTKKALASGLMPIVCVGETLEERDAGKHFEKVRTQVASLFGGISAEDAEKVTVAYEPIWAIGTGRNATPAQAEEMCAYIRSVVREISGDKAADALIIQYGGSVKTSNCAELMAMEDIDGALVGGAGLDPKGICEIIKSSYEAKRG